MKKLLVATNNLGKIKEYKLIFKKLLPEIKIVSLKGLNISAKVNENGKNFKENAVKKASFYSKLSNFPTLSDDSGLEIDYLKGEPGVKSRRWPGYEATDKELIDFTLKKLAGVQKNKRGAQLWAVVCLIFSKERKNYLFEGILRGFIARKPIKKRIKGYPFRSIFVPAGNKKYLGELGLVAHRKQAIEKAIPLLKKKLSRAKTPPSIQ